MKRIVVFFVVSFVFALFIWNCSNDGSKEKSKSDSGKQKGEPQQNSVQRDYAIDFTLTGLDGVERTLSEQKGSVVIVDFWATWCPPCRVEIPHLKKIYDTYKDKGLIVWGIGLDKEEKLSQFAQENSINYPVLVGNQTIAKQYNVQGIPTTFLYDKKNRIAYRHTGFAEGMEKDFEKEIVGLLQE